MTTQTTLPLFEEIQLDPEQRAAVEHGDGPLLIVAGAGTGKTAVIARRIAHLIESKRARPSQILALAFNEKAAAEMQERVDVLVPYGYADVTVRTFHSFGEDVLSGHGMEIGIAPGFSVLDQTAQALFLAERLDELGLARYAPLSDPTRYLSSLATYFGRAKDEPIWPDQLRDRAAWLDEEDARDRVIELAHAYERYNELLWEAGFVDFGDLLALTLKLFDESPGTLRRFQERFTHVLVDEFQDTNPVQFEIVKRLTALHRNLVVVGDDDQSIYGFRGAHLKNILDFYEQYPDAKGIVLRRNYRSTKPILEVSRRLITMNRERLETRAKISKTLTTEAEGEFPRWRDFDTEAEEAEWVAEQMAEAVASGPRRYRDFAILVRTNRTAEPFLRALDARGIPYYFSGSRGLFQRPEVKELVALLRALFQESKPEYLYLLAAEGYGVAEDDLARLIDRLPMEPLSFRSVLERAAEGTGIFRDMVSDDARAKLGEMLAHLRELHDFAKGKRTGEVLYRYLELRGVLRKLVSSERFEDEARARNIVKFFSIVRSFEKVAVSDRVALFLRHLDAIQEYGEDPAVADIDSALDVVQVLTVHKAKGLEFPVVFLVQLAAGRFPTNNRSGGLDLPAPHRDAAADSESHREEERRLCYVAFTRAREELILTYARDYGGLGRERAPSLFLQEAFDLGKPVPAKRRKRAIEELEEHRPGLPALALVDTRATREPLDLSVRRLEDYETCPLKYRFLHEISVDPILTRDHRVNFGNAMHQAVAHALNRRMEGHKPSFDEVAEVFQRAWRREGYRSEEHERRRFEQGLQALRDFMAREIDAGPMPSAVERVFRVKLDDVVVTGRMDRVDDQDGETVLIDYKTTELDDPEKGDQEAKESLQLSVYALAHRELTGKTPHRVELRYVLTGDVGRAGPDDKRLEKTRAKIADIAASIRAGDFEARPSERNCSICACRPICSRSVR